jgi:ABC-type transport system involved in Fe-S cluster assembly fused permease/ATPase subunit
LQGNYYDFGENSGISTKLYGITAAGRVGAAARSKSTVAFSVTKPTFPAHWRSSVTAAKKPVSVSARNTSSRVKAIPEGVRLAVGAGYFDVSGLNNQRV